MYKCQNCRIDFEAKREAKTCSRNCRVTLSRKGTNVTHNVTLSAPDVTHKFKFTIKHTKKLGVNTDDIAEAKARVREASYWYDVPLAAVPVYQKDWPKMPEFINGRQYFLWWKNEFKQNDGVPEIHNPFPSKGKEVYIKAGDNSRYWGTN